MDCGYPLAEVGNLSVPGLFRGCILSATTAHSLKINGANGAAWLAPGRYAAFDGSLPALGSLSEYDLLPGSTIVACDGAVRDHRPVPGRTVPGPGGSCAYTSWAFAETRPAGTLQPGKQTALPPWMEAAQFIQVTPVPTAFANLYYAGGKASLGDVAQLDFGTYRVSNGTLGDFVAQSLYVPAGAAVRLCTSEGTGSGGGTCYSYTYPQENVYLPIGTSYPYLETSPRVVIYKFRDYSGVSSPLNVGTFTVSPSVVKSIIIPPPLYVQACTTNGAYCETWTNSIGSVTGPLASGIASLTVTNVN
jgi:hypothetical protein